MGKSSLRLTISKLASLEAESWRKANQNVEKVDKDYDDPHTTIVETLPPLNTLSHNFPNRFFMDR